MSEQKQTLSPFKAAMAALDKCWRQKSDGMWHLQQPLVWIWIGDHRDTIETACNAHEDLVEALEHAKAIAIGASSELWKKDWDQAEEDFGLTTSGRLINAALAQAKAGA